MYLCKLYKFLQLEQTIDLIGIPKEEDYPEIKTLMVKRGLENLYKSYEGKGSRLSTSFSFDLKELEVLSNTITWEKYRMSALDIINLEYFDEIRKKIFQKYFEKIGFII